MVKKNNKPKRTFIPQSIGDSIKNINRNFTSKFNKLDFVIQSNWSEIVGSYFKEYTEPNQITKVPDFKNELEETEYKNYLNVSVAPAVAIEFQHFKNVVIEKINSYFGYKAISEIRIHQKKDYKENNNYQLKMKENSSKIDENMIKKDVNGLEDKDLEKSIIKLGVSISKLEK